MRTDSGNTQGQRDLQMNFFALENIFPYTCADFFFCLREHRNKTKGKLWGMFNIGGVPFLWGLFNIGGVPFLWGLFNIRGVPFCESLTSTESLNPKP